MKIVSKIFLILMVVMCVAIVMPKTEVMAEGEAIMDGVEIPKDRSVDTATVISLGTVVARLLGFLQVASGLIAVVMIAVTGFRYIIETPEMKNELKKSMIPIIVGILLVFFATSIARFFIGVFSNTN